MARVKRLVRRAATQPASLALSAIVLVGLGLRLVFPFGLVKVDPFTYADAAISIARWEPVFDPNITGDLYYTQYVRLTLIVPAAILYRVFGINDFTSVVFPVVASLAMAVMAWWLLRRTLGQRPALWAAGLVAVFPLYVVNSTQFLPDMVQAAFGALAMVTFLRALLFNDLSARQRAWLYFASGASLALAFYSRGTAVALLPPLALLLVLHWRRFDWTPLAAVAGGLAVLFVFQALILALGSAPLEDFRVLYALSGSSFNPGTGYLRIMITDAGFWPWTWLTVAGAIVWAFEVRRGFIRSPFAALVILAVGQYVYFEYYMSLPGLPAWWKEPRYILSLVFPMLLIAGAGVGLVFDRLAGRPRLLETGLGAALGAVLVGASVYGVWDEYDFYRVDGNPWDSKPGEVARFLGQHPTGDVFISNDDFARPLSFHLDGAGTFYERMVTDDGRLRQRFSPGGASAATVGSSVVVIPREDWWPEPTASAPHWERVFGRSGETAVYDVVDPDAADIAVHRETAGARELGIESVGLGQTWLLPGHHAAVELAFAAPSAGRVFEMRLACGEQYGESTELVVPPGATVVRADLVLPPPARLIAPARCSLQASGRDLIELLVPMAAVTQAENLSGDGWSSFLDSRFDGVLGLRGTGNLTLDVPVAQLDAGDYWVEARIYDYGSGVGQMAGTLNGVAAATTWGGGEAGMTTAVLYFASVPAGANLQLRFGGDQPAVLVDALVLSSVEPPTLTD